MFPNGVTYCYMKRNLIIDTLGSDKGASAILDGAKLILDNYKDISLTIVGDENEIKKHDLDFSRVNIVHAPDTITNYDNPMMEFYSGKVVSIFKAMEELAKGESIGMISAGNSGAVLVGSVRYLLTKEKIRPCLAAIVPNTMGGYTALVDTGASIDVSAYQLHEFAKLGRDFIKKLYKIDNPRIGLLSNGSEPTKGNKLVKEAYKILEADESLNFVGNIEGNKTLSGLCDVLVCDGFAGNQVLKNAEGMAVNLITEMVKYAKKNHEEEHIMPLVGYLMKTYDFESLGAGIVLGTTYPVVKCRGSSGKEAILSAASILINMSEDKNIYEGKDSHRR